MTIEGNRLEKSIKNCVQKQEVFSNNIRELQNDIEDLHKSLITKELNIKDLELQLRYENFNNFIICGVKPLKSFF